MRRNLFVVALVLIGAGLWLIADPPSLDRPPDRRDAGPAAGPIDPGVVGNEEAGADDPPIELPEDGLPVAGVVVDETGGPIPGVRIRVRSRTEGGRRFNDLLITATGTDGTFRLDRVPRGPVRVLADDRHRESAGLDAAAGDEDLRFILAAAGEIRGTLILPDGTTEPGGRLVQIEYECVRGVEERDTVVSDPYEELIDGLDYRLPSLPPGRYIVWARVVGVGCGEVKKVEVLAGQTTEADIVIREGGVLTGLVVDGEGKPVPGATVGAVDEETGSALDAIRENIAHWHLGVIVTTDDDGRFRMVGLRDGTYSVGAVAPGYRIAQVFDVQVPRKGDLPPIRLDPGASLEFIVPEADDVWIVYISQETGTIDAEPDEEGRGRIDGIPPGEQTVGANGKGWSILREVDFKAGEVHRMEIRRPTGAAVLIGTVTRGGVPQADRYLRVRYADTHDYFSGRTDKEGRFRFERLPLGTPGVQVGSGTDWPSFSALQHMVKLREGENRLNIELPVGRIRLRVVSGETGEPLEARIHVSRVRVAREEPDDGIHLVEDLEPRSYEVVVRCRGHGPRRITVKAAKDPKPVRVALASASQLEFVIRDVAGNPVPYPWIRIVDEDGWDLADDAWDWGFVDEKTGRYRYGLARGTYTVRVGAEGYREWEGKVETPVPGGRIKTVLQKE